MPERAPLTSAHSGKPVSVYMDAADIDGSGNVVPLVCIEDPGTATTLRYTGTVDQVRDALKAAGVAGNKSALNNARTGLPALFSRGNDISGDGDTLEFLRINDPANGVLRYYGTPEDLDGTLAELLQSEHIPAPVVVTDGNEPREFGQPA